MPAPAPKPSPRRAVRRPRGPDGGRPRGHPESADMGAKRLPDGGQTGRADSGSLRLPRAVLENHKRNGADRRDRRAASAPRARRVAGRGKTARRRRIRVATRTRSWVQNSRFQRNFPPPATFHCSRAFLRAALFRTVDKQDSRLPATKKSRGDSRLRPQEGARVLLVAWGRVVARGRESCSPRGGAIRLAASWHASSARLRARKQQNQRLACAVRWTILVRRACAPTLRAVPRLWPSVASAALAFCDATSRASLVWVGACCVCTQFLHGLMVSAQ